MLRRYEIAVAAWGGAGWRDVFPLPPGQKAPPPAGVIGASGSGVTDEKRRRWLVTRPSDNAGLLLPIDVIGLDVDAYDDKRGHRTLAKHIVTYGPLPATWSVSSRSDGRSGIRLFRFKPSQNMRGDLDGGHVDLIHRGLRYVVLPPSLHPDGRTYALLGPDGALTEVPPAESDLPELPELWHLALSKTPSSKPQAATSHSRKVASSRHRSPLEAAQDRWVTIALSVLEGGQGKLIRDVAGLTIEDLAKHLGLNRARASHLELGQLSSRLRKPLLARYGQFLDWAAASSGQSLLTLPD